jgi:7,8-didemethyl-8-hydroxy-5-deazariboflavin synthase, CofG subunit
MSGEDGGNDTTGLKGIQNIPKHGSGKFLPFFRSENRGESGLRIHRFEWDDRVNGHLGLLYQPIPKRIVFFHDRYHFRYLFFYIPPIPIIRVTLMVRTITYSRNVFLPLTTVCRNRCGYCSFRTPVQPGAILSPDQVRNTLNMGAASGCTEALFTFGEKPEWEEGFSMLLSRYGYDSILTYCHAMCRESIARGILPHTNAGVLTMEEMAGLRRVNASMGIMLETTARIPAHRQSPGKDPEKRIEMMENAGRLRIPFTTGILVGIGETLRDREESLAVIRDLHRRYDHIQEVIIQNFCPKEGTIMQGAPVPSKEEMCATIAMARDILPDSIAVQIPPNLIDAAALIACGVDDLGGVSPLTPDYINPEHPWPEIEHLRDLVGNARLQERLCIYPRFIKKGWYPAEIEGLIKMLEQKIQERS